MSSNSDFDKKIGVGSTPKLGLDGDKIIIKSAVEPELTLNELVAGITEENLHSEVDMGPAAGNEIW